MSYELILLNNNRELFKETTEFESLKSINFKLFNNYIDYVKDLYKKDKYVELEVGSEKIHNQIIDYVSVSINDGDYVYFYYFIDNSVKLKAVIKEIENLINRKYTF